jgi:hypothetical protein
MGYQCESHIMSRTVGWFFRMAFPIGGKGVEKNAG